MPSYSAVYSNLISLTRSTQIMTLLSEKSGLPQSYERKDKFYSLVLKRFQIYITADFLISETALTRSPTAPSRPGVPSLPAGPYKESSLKNELTE